MCDHKWILLTSQELERRLGYPGASAWSVRGCEQCLEVEANKPYEGNKWRPLGPTENTPSHILMPLSNQYWTGIDLFRGGRDV